MTWDKGFNFRATAAYVTDGANETYVETTSTYYPTTRNGVTFGYSVAASIDERNWSTSSDPELAGVNFNSNSGTQAVFRVDLPVAGGTYDIRLAIGDIVNARAPQYVQLRDGATVLLTIDKPGGSALGSFFDAVGVQYSAANWPGSNTAARVTVSGAVLTVAIGTPTAQSGVSTIAHLFISQVDAAPIEVLASGAATLPHLTASGTGAALAKASGSATLPHFTASGTATSPHQATGAATLPHLTASGTAQAPAKASGAAQLPHLTASGTASVGNAAHASGTVTLPHLTASGTAQSPHAASGSTVLPHLTASGGAQALTKAGGAVSLPHFVASGQAKALAKASGLAVLPMLRVSATGHTQPVGAHDAALTGTVATRARLTGAIAAHPQLTGSVAARPRLTGTITLRPLP